MTFFKFLLTVLLFASPLFAEIKDITAMSLDEKIGQLLICGAYSNQEDAKSEGQNEHPIEYVEKMVQNYHIGGLLFKMRWDPISQKHFVEHYQNLSATPILTMQDLEWGLTQRHATGMRFPKNMTLGAIQDDTLIYNLGREIGRQARIVGIDCNLAPVVDVNSNPDNPIIGDRSFGDNPEKVAKLGCLYMKGLQDEGIVACAKHFPGHGDTATDSHTALPQVLRTEAQLRKCELIPFQKMIENGVPCIMTAHIVLPAIDGTPNLPSTLSYECVTRLLKNSLKFKGIVITDDLLMKAISGLYSPGQAAVMAFQAGCDMLMSSKDIPECFEALKKAVLNGTISETELNVRVAKILKLKEWVQTKKSVPSSDLNSENAQTLKKELYRAAITAVNPTPHAAPSALLQIGGTFQDTFSKAMGMPIYYLNPESSLKEQELTLKSLQEYPSVIVNFAEMSRRASERYGITDRTLTFLQKLQQSNKSVTYVLFGSPYAMKFLGKDKSYLIAYEDDPDAKEAAADVLLGKIQPTGVLPIK